MRLYLLRHGETEWNLGGRIQGQLDIPLSEVGIEQALRWRPYFDGISLAAVYSSALSRTMQTAVLATGRPPCIIPELNERCFGELEGQVWRRDLETVLDFSPSGAETREQLKARVQTALESIVAEHGDAAEILVVCHGGSGRVILGWAGQEPRLLANASLEVLTLPRPQKV